MKNVTYLQIKTITYLSKNFERREETLTAIKPRLYMLRSLVVAQSVIRRISKGGAVTVGFLLLSKLRKIIKKTTNKVSNNTDNTLLY